MPEASKNGLNDKVMRRLLIPGSLVLLLAIMFSSCGPKPQYKTAEGKRKLKYYNDIQYDRKKPNFKRWN